VLPDIHLFHLILTCEVHECCILLLFQDRSIFCKLRGVDQPAQNKSKDYSISIGYLRKWNQKGITMHQSENWRTSSTRMLGSGEMTVRDEKSTLLPLRFPRKRPCFPTHNENNQSDLTNNKINSQERVNWNE
jgi:hypothetical protein